jgi:hypothetical protein
MWLNRIGSYDSLHSNPVCCFLLLNYNYTSAKSAIEEMCVGLIIYGIGKQLLWILSQTPSLFPLISLIKYEHFLIPKFYNAFVSSQRISSAPFPVGIIWDFPYGSSCSIHRKGPKVITSWTLSPEHEKRIYLIGRFDHELTYAASQARRLGAACTQWRCDRRRNWGSGRRGGLAGSSCSASDLHGQGGRSYFRPPQLSWIISWVSSVLQANSAVLPSI